MGELLFLIGLVGLVAGAVAIARWVLRPLDQAAKGRRAPAQFTLVDFLCLVFMAQLPTGLITWALASVEYGGAGVVYAFGWIACGLLWWTAIRTLGRAGVQGTWRRAGFLALVLPVTVFGAICVPPLAVMTMIGLLMGDFPGDARGFALALLAQAGFGAAFYACGRYTRWLVATAAPPFSRTSDLLSDAGVPGQSAGEAGEPPPD